MKSDLRSGFFFLRPGRSGIRMGECTGRGDRFGTNTRWNGFLLAILYYESIAIVFWAWPSPAILGSQLPDLSERLLGAPA